MGQAEGEVAGEEVVVQQAAEAAAGAEARRSDACCKPQNVHLCSYFDGNSKLTICWMHVRSVKYSQ